MPDVLPVTGYETTRTEVQPGFKVTTHSQGDRYVTILRYVDDDHEVVEPTSRVVHRGDGSEKLDVTATEAVVAAIEDRGLEVQQ